MENNKIKVERETFESNGKEYFSYFIKGNVRGRDIKAGVIPPTKAAIPFWISSSTVRWKPNLS